MKEINQFTRIHLGQFPTPMYLLNEISRKYEKNIWIKRDDLCGVALGGNKVRKLEFLLGEAKEKGADVVFTTGGAQSNHAMLTAACAARLGMKCILLLKDRGVTGRKGNLVLDEIYGAQVQLIDTDSYDDIYRLMDEIGTDLEKQGHKYYKIPCGGSNALGCLGYTRAAAEIMEQAEQIRMEDGTPLKLDAVISATGSGGTTGGLLLGKELYLPDTMLFGVAVDNDPFEIIAPQIAEEGAKLLGTDLASLGYTKETAPHHFLMYHNWGEGYAIPNAEDTPYIKEMAQKEGILLDPVYTGKAWSGFLKKLEEGAFDSFENILFVHTGGAAALFAMDLP